MPFDVASIKNKASHVKNASVTKFQDTRDRYSSTPMAKSKFVDDGVSPAHKPPPPPPPPSRVLGASSATRSPSSEQSSSGGAPLVLRASKPKPSFSPASATSYSAEAKSSNEVDHIDWVNISPEDKEEFFAWLDEFFSQYLGYQVGPSESTTTNQDVVEANVALIAVSSASLRYLTQHKLDAYAQQTLRSECSI